MPTLYELLKAVEMGTPMACRNLQLVPLVKAKQGKASLDYLLAADAFERGTLKVTEVDAGGSVPELLAISEASVAILLLGGEELIGAKQNRILNTDVLLRPRGKSKIPVSCVEEGRWHYTRADFDVGCQAPPPIRARQSRSVSRSLRESNVAMADQAEVWDDVGAFLACMGTPSETGAMADVFRQRRRDFEVIVTGLPCPDEAVGVVAVIDGAFAALDLFDRPTTLRHVWNRLVTGYAADAVMKETAKRSAESQSDVGSVLDRVRRVECAVCPGVDLGEDWRFDSPDLVGSALVVDGAPVHVSAFPGTDDRDERESPGPRIVSPSQRRRRRPR